MLTSYEYPSPSSTGALPIPLGSFCARGCSLASEDEAESPSDGTTVDVEEDLLNGLVREGARCVSFNSIDPLV